MILIQEVLDRIKNYLSGTNLLNTNSYKFKSFSISVPSHSVGTVVLWDLQNKSPLMWKNESTLRPQRCFQMHSGPVVSLAWCSAVPNLLASSSLDFHMCLTDVDRPGTIHAGNVMFLWEIQHFSAY